VRDAVFAVMTDHAFRNQILRSVWVRNAAFQVVEGGIHKATSWTHR
jgi:hypothetical protein